MAVIQWSVVLATIATIIGLLASSGAFVNTPYGPFFTALAQFITAVSALLVGLGYITLVRKLKKLGIKL